MEKRYDNKVQTYFEELEKLLTHKIESSKRSFTSQVENLKKNNSDFKAFMEKKIQSNLSKTDTIGEHTKCPSYGGVRIIEVIP